MSSEESDQSDFDPDNLADIPRSHFSARNIAKIYEPLLNLTAAQVETVGKTISQEYHSYKSKDLFVKAARIIHRPNFIYAKAANSKLTKAEWKGLVTTVERRALEREAKTTFWDQPGTLKTAYLMLFLAAIVQGWSQTGISAANLNWPVTFGVVSNTAESCNLPLSEAWKVWEVAGVNAVLYLVAGMSCWIFDTLNEHAFGRRWTITFSSILIMASAIGSGVSQNWRELLTTRVLLGVGMGCKATVAPVYAAEIAPSHLRGELLIDWQVFHVLGILLGFLVNVIVSYAVSDSNTVWRWQLASLFIPSFALFCATLFVPWDSPRLLMKHEETHYRIYCRLKMLSDPLQAGTPTREQGEHGVRERFEKISPWMRLWYSASNRFRPRKLLPYKSPAFEALKSLRGSSIVAAKELIFTHCQTLIEGSSGSKQQSRVMDPRKDFSIRSKWFGRMVRGLSKPYFQQELRAAATMMIAQQLCGINILILYSSSLFCNVHVNNSIDASRTPLGINCALGFVNFLCTLRTYKWIESHKRRWLILTTIPFLTVTLAIAAGIVGSQLDEEPKQALLILFTFLFTVFYSPGLGPVPFIYSAEAFPLERRMIGMSWAVSVNLLFAGILTLVVTALISAIHAAGLHGLFTGLNIIAFLAVWGYVPEIVGTPTGEDVPLQAVRAQDERNTPTQE